jgi:uncharacterized damage-inducible protein DinB
VDLLDRFLGHDGWTTGRLLVLSRGLADEHLDQRFDIGHETLRETFAHMIGNVEIWTDLMAERPVDRTSREVSMDALIERHERSCAGFASLARRIRDEGRFDESYVDTLDDPPTSKTLGGTIVHVITHNMFHRGEALHILQRLGVADLPEGDALSWEATVLRGDQSA